MIHPKLCGNCALPQNFHTRKLGESTVFYAVISTEIYSRVLILSKYMAVLYMVGTLIFNVTIPENFKTDTTRNQ